MTGNNPDIARQPTLIVRLTSEKRAGTDKYSATFQPTLLPTIPAITTGVFSSRQSVVTSANTAAGDFLFRRVTRKLIACSPCGGL